MTQPSTNPSFHKGLYGNTTGTAAPLVRQNTIEFLAADPTDLATTSPRAWVNTTTGLLKFTTNAAGTPVKTVTAT